MAMSPSDKRPDGRPIGRPFQKANRANPIGRRASKLKVRVLLKGYEEDFVGALVRDLTGDPGPECTAAQRLYSSYRWGKPSESVLLDATGAISVNIMIPGEGES